jgi:hypothetical protein
MVGSSSNVEQGFKSSRSLNPDFVAPRAPPSSRNDRKSMKENQPIPTPAHPDKRREALPWQQPKAIEEDPEAMRRVQAILKSPSYRTADTDTEFLAEDDLRGVRLQIDYLKPELLLREHEIEQAIVVFGSTRICEPGAALRKVQELRALLEVDKSNGELRRRLAVCTENPIRVCCARIG